MASAGAGPSEGAAAVWRLSEEPDPQAPTQHLELLVMRTGCAGGVTGEVTGTSVRYEDERILITAEVEPISGNFTCPGNDETPATIELTEPIEDRPLVDALCLESPHSEYAYCSDGPERWTPADGLSTPG